ELETIPLKHPEINKGKRIKDGAMASNDSVIYAVKGGGSNEFWQYVPKNRVWFPLETIPKLNNKSVLKTGATLTYLNGKIYLLKGNNTNEFWSYFACKKEPKIFYDIITSNIIITKFPEWHQLSGQKLILNPRVYAPDGRLIINNKFVRPGIFFIVNSNQKIYKLVVIKQ
ncbi:MAG: hypothetical protein NZ601_05405, partial [candidate division WOR-3 bacterium]|nr:hypothetical protein [candidate division WOR-3 bacterium]MDW7988205.1 hypothetical protein [candidate division WOR-3 bacterium]